MTTTEQLNEHPRNRDKNPEKGFVGPSTPSIASTAAT